ncbi:hypothetical protein EB093_07790 [bacterium]|nr:hypothetical protein [bacterium]
MKKSVMPMKFEIVPSCGPLAFIPMENARFLGFTSPFPRLKLKSVFPGTSWNRCHTHLARNAQDHISKAAHKTPVAQDIRSILQAPDLDTAQFLLNRFSDRWPTSEPKLAHWAQINLPQGFQVFSIDPKLRRTLRISNLIERFNCEIKRRSRVVRIFPNFDSCLRLVSAILIE